MAEGGRQKVRYQDFTWCLSCSLAQGPNVSENSPARSSPEWAASSSRCQWSAISADWSSVHSTRESFDDRNEVSSFSGDRC